MISELNLVSIGEIINFLRNNDSKQFRDKLLTTDELKYLYCRDIKDRQEVWGQITDPKWAYWYCKDIEDRPEVRKCITKPYWLQKYNKWKKEKTK